MNCQQNTDWTKRMRIIAAWQIMCNDFIVIFFLNLLVDPIMNKLLRWYIGIGQWPLNRSIDHLCRYGNVFFFLYYCFVVKFWACITSLNFKMRSEQFCTWPWVIKCNTVYVISNVFVVLSASHTNTLTHINRST